MKLVLPRTKHTVPDEKWNSAWKNITELVSRRELDKEFVSPALRRLEVFTKKYPFWVFGWSGGKDSWPLVYFAEQILPETYGAFADYGVLEFPVMREYLSKYTPNNVASFINPRFQNYDWIEEYQDRYLFPTNSKDTYYYATHGAHYAQQEIYKMMKADAIILGRRNADGNITGKDGLMGGKRVQFSPMYDWPHEAVLAFMKYYEYPMAPCYEWPNGFSVGTCNWAGFLYKEKKDGWAHVESIDPELVQNIAPRFVSGREYLARRN